MVSTAPTNDSKKLTLLTRVLTVDCRSSICTLRLETNSVSYAATIEFDFRIPLEVARRLERRSCFGAGADATVAVA